MNNDITPNQFSQETIRVLEIVVKPILQQEYDTHYSHYKRGCRGCIASATAIVRAAQKLNLTLNQHVVLPYHSAVSRP